MWRVLAEFGSQFENLENRLKTIKYLKAKKCLPKHTLQTWRENKPVREKTLIKNRLSTSLQTLQSTGFFAKKFIHVIDNLIYAIILAWNRLGF